MTLNWNEITRISIGVVRELQRPLDVVGVTRVGKSANRVEVLISTGDGRLMLNVTRVTASLFEEDFRNALRRALRQ
jgi:hypothetical protein